MEIDEKKEEVKELHKEMAKMKKDSDAKYSEVVEEAKKVSETLKIYKKIATSIF